MENIFNNLFPITGKNPENNKVLKLEMEIERLKLCLKMANQACEKRKAAMDIMIQRLEEQDALIKRLNSVLRRQDMALGNMQKTMKRQQAKLEHLTRIDNRMNELQSDQAEILQFAQEYREAQC